MPGVPIYSFFLYANMSKILKGYRSYSAVKLGQKTIKVHFFDSSLHKIKWKYLVLGNHARKRIILSGM